MSKKQHEAEHIIVQLRKVVNTHGHSNVRFDSGTVNDISIVEAQSVLAMYNDSPPADKAVIQAYATKSPHHLRQIVSGDWRIPVINVDRPNRPLFNTDEIFGLDSDPVRVHRPIIKKKMRVVTP